MSKKSEKIESEKRPKKSTKADKGKRKKKGKRKNKRLKSADVPKTPIAIVSEQPSPDIEAKKRIAMIETAAYYPAEQRGFAPGNELDDWFKAEKAIDKKVKATRGK